MQRARPLQTCLYAVECRMCGQMNANARPGSSGGRRAFQPKANNMLLPTLASPSSGSSSGGDTLPIPSLGSSCVQLDQTKRKRTNPSIRSLAPPSRSLFFKRGPGASQVPFAVRFNYHLSRLLSAIPTLHYSLTFLIRPIKNFPARAQSQRWASALATSMRCARARRSSSALSSAQI